VAFVTYITFYLQWNITTWRWRTILSVMWRYQWWWGGTSEEPWCARYVAFGITTEHVLSSLLRVCKLHIQIHFIISFVLPMLCCALVAEVQRLPTDALHCCGVRVLCIAQGDYRLWAIIGNKVIVTQKLNACHCKEQLKTFFLHARVTVWV
jgi:hypothetical protein